MFFAKRFSSKLFLIICFCLFALLVVAFVAIGHDDWFSCQIENLKNGHFRSDNFGREIAVSGDPSSLRVDFSGVQRFEKFCIVEMYTHGQANESREVDDLKLKGNAMRACFRHEQGKLIVLGAYVDKSVAWTQIAVSRQEVRFSGPECADRSNAIIQCRDSFCSFVQ